MHVRVNYFKNPAQHPDEMANFSAKDPDIDDMFDPALLEKSDNMWNNKDLLRWHIGAQACGKVATAIPE